MAITLLKSLCALAASSIANPAAAIPAANASHCAAARLTAATAGASTTKAAVNPRIATAVVLTGPGSSPNSFNIYVALLISGVSAGNS